MMRAIPRVVETMDSLIYRIFVSNRAQNLLSLTLAILIWIFVHHSITATKTLSSIPIRITNLPADMTIHGLQPNGVLDQSHVNGNEIGD